MKGKLSTLDTILIMTDSKYRNLMGMDLDFDD
jgi:hypothetical protein